MRKNLFAFILALTILSSAIFAQTTAEITARQRQTAEMITADQLKDYLYFVASDEMGGRNTPSDGLNLTAKFIGTMLSRWGVKPAGDNGTYFQKIGLSREKIVPADTNLQIGGQNLIYGTDFIANAAAGTITGKPLIFGGEGWLIKSKNIEPLKDVDVSGKILVIYSDNAPREISLRDLSANGKRGENWADPMTYAKQKGAAGIIVVATPTFLKNWDAMRLQRENGRYGVDKLREETEANLPTVYISPRAAAKLFNGETIDLNKIIKDYEDKKPLPVFAFGTDKSAALTVVTETEKTMTQNVVGLIEGSDPKLKEEMVAIGAHYDHIGMNPNAPGADKIFNGADDDGSGTVAVLSIAETLAKAQTKPKRSILFVWHCGEEKGLWGSEYFNKFPTVNIKNVVAQLNIDMIGRSKKPGYKAPCDVNLKPNEKPCNAELSGESEIYVIGSQMMSSTLGAVTKATNDGYLKLDYDYRYDDPKDKNRFFFRSDHFNYAQNGIPIVFWFDGVHEDYHQLGDEPQKIDYQKMEKITRTIFLTLWNVADLPQRPAIDRQLPPELTQR